MSVDLRLGIQPGKQGIPADHSAQLQAALELLGDIRDQSGIVVEEVDPISARGMATKGGAQELLLAPGTASAAWAVVRIVKLWLARDRRRTIEVTVRQPGHEPFTIHGSGENLSLSALENTLRQALKSSDGGHVNSGDDSGARG